MTKLIIIRHGNTFNPDQTPLRVGAGTDIPLVTSGREQAKNIGLWLKQNKLMPAVIYCSELKRTYETAKLIIKELDNKIPIIKNSKFNEIDYGPDEGKAEIDVINRLGIEAIQAWDQDTKVPPGWQVDPEIIIKNWLVFASDIEKNYNNKIICVVTSNGIGRFAPYLTGHFEKFKEDYNIKLSTGALSILDKKNNNWEITQWNFRPYPPYGHPNGNQ